MGEYFLAANHSKKEYFTAWRLGSGAKLREWCMSSCVTSVFPYLLRQPPEYSYCSEKRMEGRWAGDEIALVGDESSREQFREISDEYFDISDELVKQFNEFIGDSRHQIHPTLVFSEEEAVAQEFGEMAIKFFREKVLPK